MSHRRPVPALSILYADADILVVDKPPGVVAAPGRAGEPTVPELIRDCSEFAQDEPVRLVHRLDKEASGVLLYARTLPAQRELTAQFVERRVEKMYLTLVTGHVASDGEVDLPIGPDKSGEHMRVSSRRSKPALTRYRVIQHLPGNTWLECRPVTGRRHQIRVHLAALGHPLTVDALYGGGTAVLLSQYKPGYKPSHRRPERPLIDRLTLHAARITFHHPADGRMMTFEAPLPKDLRATLSQLSRLVRPAETQT